MNKKPSYGWKDLLSDFLFITMILAALAIIVGSFPEFASKLLPFLK